MNPKSFVKKVLKSSSLGKAIYPLFQKPYLWYAIPARRRRLRKHGVDAMRRLHGFMVSNGIDYYCDSGTLLGFVRDHGFIKTDDDIDVAIVEGSIAPAELLRKMIAAGYEYVHAFDYNGQMLEFTVADKTGITVDCFFQTLQKGSTTILDAWGVYWKPDCNYPSETANSVISYPFLKPTGFKLLNVMGIQVRIPDHPEDVLESEYPGWRIPDPNFKHDQDVPHTDWPGYAYRLAMDEALGHK